MKSLSCSKIKSTCQQGLWTNFRRLPERRFLQADIRRDSRRNWQLPNRATHSLGDVQVSLAIGRARTGSGPRPAETMALTGAWPAARSLDDDKSFQHLSLGTDLSYACADRDGKNHGMAARPLIYGLATGRGGVRAFPVPRPLAGAWRREAARRVAPGAATEAAVRAEARLEQRVRRTSSGQVDSFFAFAGAAATCLRYGEQTALGGVALRQATSGVLTGVARPISSLTLLPP